MGNSFFEAEESQFIEQFLQQGYIIFPLEDLEGLRTIKTNLYQWAMEYLGLKNSLPEKDLGDQIHQWVTLEEVNDFRVHLINRLKKDMNLRPKIYHLAKKYIHWIVGNELAMQRSCNLSIQMPQDDSSLLPLHSDVWSGNSPYEIVFWFPFVDCYKTKSMFILPKKETDRILDNFDQYASLDAEELYEQVKNQIHWLDVPYGHGVIFTHSLLHGNRLNEEDQTRWTINVRFKALQSPYSDKELGESFLPITMRPITRIGYHYKKTVFQ